MENKTIKEMTIPVSRILKLAEMLKDLEPNERIGFTYIISFLFPNAWKNIQDSLKNLLNIFMIKGYLNLLYYYLIKENIGYIQRCIIMMRHLISH